MSTSLHVGVYRLHLCKIRIGTVSLYRKTPSRKESGLGKTWWSCSTLTSCKTCPRKCMCHKGTHPWGQSIYSSGGVVLPSLILGFHVPTERLQWSMTNFWIEMTASCSFHQDKKAKKKMWCAHKNLHNFTNEGSSFDPVWSFKKHAIMI